MPWKPIVISAIVKQMPVVSKNIHQLIGARYAKSCSRLFMVYHAMGEAMHTDNNNSFTTSLESRIKISRTVRPQYFAHTDFPYTLLRSKCHETIKTQAGNKDGKNGKEQEYLSPTFLFAVLFAEFFIEKCSAEWLRSSHDIYTYSKDYKYNQAILFIVSGHRKSMIKNFEENKFWEDVKLNWTIYNNKFAVM
jgi:hypothetical protein